MNIIVFGKYKVKFENHFSYIDEDYNFLEDSTQWEKELNGYELMQLISDIMSRRETISINSESNCLYFEQYQPNGEFADICITWEFLS